MDSVKVSTQYEDSLRHVLETGVPKGDRTNTGVFSVFGLQLRYDLAKGLPLINTKDISLETVAKELCWFMRGESNIRTLGAKIWNEWADENGDLGPIYGVQWRTWPTPNGGHIDQIAQVMGQLRTNPNSRRHIVSAWNVAEIDNMALPPCHMMFQFYVAEGKLSCQVYQRSADMFLGVPFNIASYALLTHMMAQQVGLEVGDLIWVGGDCHVYLNHVAQARLQLTRTPFPFPTLVLEKAIAIDKYDPKKDFKLLNYRHHARIPARIAV